MNICILTPDDIPAVATIHRAAFPRAAISRLGHAATRRYYHSLMSGLHDTTGLGVFEHNQLSGFCFVGVRHIAELFYVRHHAPYLAWRVATHPWLLMESFIWSRIGSGLRFLLPHSKASVAAPATGPSSDSSYGIQYIAVHPSRQGRGLGKQLLLASEELARRHGCTELRLSVYLDNIGAIGFYDRMGWQKIFQDGAWRGLMLKRFTKADSVDILPMAVNPLAMAASL